MMFLFCNIDQFLVIAQLSFLCLSVPRDSTAVRFKMPVPRDSSAVHLIPQSLEIAQLSH